MKSTLLTLLTILCCIVARAQTHTFNVNEKDHILKALAACNHKIYGPGGAAELLAINASTLRSRMNKLGIGKKFIS